MCKVYCLLGRDIIYIQYIYIYIYVCVCVRVRARACACMYCTLAYMGIISLSYIIYEGNILVYTGHILNNFTIIKSIIIFS